MLLPKYKKELKILEDLFSPNLIESKLENIIAIYNASEFYWDENLNYIINNVIKIKCLLIGEAPPDDNITKKDEVKYFYNPNNTTVPQSYLEKIFNALYPEQKEDHKQYTAHRKQKKLNLIADKGFLLVDSLPFAMNFSDKNKRDRMAYKNLVKECTTSYLSNKLNNPKIPWHKKGVKIAFSVLRNSRAITKNWPQDLKFRHCIVPETRTKPPFRHVAVNGSWYLCEKELKRICCKK